MNSSLVQERYKRFILDDRDKLKKQINTLVERASNTDLPEEKEIFSSLVDVFGLLAEECEKLIAMSESYEHSRTHALKKANRLIDYLNHKKSRLKEEVAKHAHENQESSKSTAIASSFIVGISDGQSKKHSILYRRVSDKPTIKIITSDCIMYDDEINHCDSSGTNHYLCSLSKDSLELNKEAHNIGNKEVNLKEVEKSCGDKGLQVANDHDAISGSNTEDAFLEVPVGNSKQDYIDTMWKVLEPASELRYRKLHHYCSYIPDHEMGTVSVRGRSHEHSGTFRDDHSIVKRISSQWNLLAVADGAGSCKYSREGSKLAIEACVDHISKSLNKFEVSDVEKHIKNLLDEGATPASKDLSQVYLGSFNQEVLFEAGKLAVRAIEMEVANSEEQVSFKDFSTTLLIAIHKSFDGQDFVSTFSIGDGLIGLVESNDVKVLCEPESGEFAGQTRFLDARAFKTDEYHSRVKTAISHDFNALFVMTDGISDPKFDSYDDFTDVNVWNSLLDEIKSLIVLDDSSRTEQNLISWAQFKSPGHHDDRSISFLLGK